MSSVLESVAVKTKTSRHARTLKRSVSASGRALFSGRDVTLTLEPWEQGVVFERVDIPGSPQLAALADSVISTPRCTILGKGSVHVQTVEHLLAALKAYQIDGVRVLLDGPEVPIFDGSALPFVELIEQAGTEELRREVPVLSLQAPVYLSQGETQIVALPADGWRISYTLHYPQSPLIGTQFYSFAVETKAFKEEIAPCRTFCLYEEIAPLIENGLLKGGGLECGLVVQKDRILNPDGLRLPGEMVRHKILDLIGDLSLVGCDVNAHILSIRSGHAANTAFAKQLMELA